MAITGVNPSDLSWVTFSTPALGSVTLELIGRDFEVWSRAAAQSLSAGTFVRELLADFARPDRNSAPLGRDVVAALTDSDLEEAAEAVFIASGVYFRPTYMPEANGNRRKARKRTENDGDTLAKQEGESSSARLLRVVQGKMADQAIIDAKLAPQPLASPDLKAALGFADAAEAFNEHRRLYHTAAELSTAARMMESFNAIDGAALRTQIDMALNTTRLLAEPNGGVFANLQRQQADFRDAMRITNFGLAAAGLPGIARFPDVFDRIGAASTFAAMSEAARVAQGLALPLSTIKGLSDAFERFASDRHTFAQQIDREFALGLSASVLAAAAAFPSPSEIALPKVSVFPQGFQLTAVFGLERVAARGLVADVLQNYDAPRTEAPAFSATVQAAHLLDIDQPSEAKTLGFLQEVGTWLVELIRNEPDVLKRNGLVGNLALILAIIGSIYTIKAYYGDEAERAANANSPPATSQEMATTLRELNAVRGQLSQQEAARGDDAKHLRYLVARAPMRIAPHGQAPLVRMVYPDQWLRMTGEQGEWVKAEVFDYQGDTLATGWVNRRWIRLTPRP